MDLAEAMAALPSAVPSHRSGAAVWEAGDVPDPPEVSVPRGCRRRLNGVVVYRRDLRPEHRALRNGLTVTSALRTALDCGRALPLPDAVAILDRLLHAKRFSIDELRSAARRERGNGSAQLRLAVAAADARSASPLETAARLLFLAEGLAVVPQYRLRADSHPYDFAIPAYKLVIEIEGFGYHATRKELDRDAGHATKAAVEGWLLLRFTWEDITLRPEQTVETIRRAMLVSACAWGQL